MKKLKKKVFRKILRIGIDAINDYNLDTYAVACNILRRHNIDPDMGAADGVPYIIYYKNKRKRIKEVKI